MNKKTVKCLSVILVLVLFVAVLTSCNANKNIPSFTRKSTSDKNTGTVTVTEPNEDDPEPTPTEPTYIKSAEELKNIKSNGYYILECDIDLLGEEWVPLGKDWEKIYFTGIFDGGGHVISNFKITEKRTYGGLFMQNRGEIKNLGVKDFEISYKNTSATVYAGGIAGMVYKGKIENCYAEGKIECSTGYDLCSTGGITGYVRIGEITNSYANVDVSAFSYYGGVYSGGLVGLSRTGKITNCYSLGNVSARSDYSDYSLIAGGLVGFSANASKINNCYAVGNVLVKTNGQDPLAGGVVGYNYTGCEVNNCYAPASQEVLIIDSGVYVYDPSNEEETKISDDVITTIHFQKDILKWDESLWTFKEGEHPKLK